ETALAVAGVAVGEVRGVSVDRDRAGLLFPLDDALVRDVAAEQITPVADPHRSFGPAQPGCEPFHRRQLQPVFLKSRVEGVDGGVGVISGRMPASRMRRCIGHLRFSLLFPRRAICYHSRRMTANQSMIRKSV